MPILFAVPVKPFGAAKGRLTGMLGDEQRRRLGAALAERTLRLGLTAGMEVLALAADAEVQVWARGLGIEARLDHGSDLNEAAAGAVTAALERRLPWVICHADLPLLSLDDLEAAQHLVTLGRTVLAPSYDGGTTLIAGIGGFRFEYGPGSFRRHLSGAVDPAVLWRVGLAQDIDEPADLEAARRHPRGAWLSDL